MLKFILAFFMVFPVLAFESGPDNGTDYVKALFAQSQVELQHSLRPIQLANVVELSIPNHFKKWLLEKNDAGEYRLDSLKLYIKNLRLEFQNDFCRDRNGKESTICFLYVDGQPVVLVSLQNNRETTLELAKAMLIHETGHFVGEKDHLFLDQLGASLVEALARPQILTVDLSITEIVPNVFIAKEECEKGTSNQAQNLLKKARMVLQEKCAELEISCDLNQINSVFTGEIDWGNDSGLTMKVTCSIHASLRNAK